MRWREFKTEVIPSSPMLNEGLMSLIASETTVNRCARTRGKWHSLRSVRMTSKSPSRKSSKTPMTMLRNVSSAPVGCAEKTSYLASGGRVSYARRAAGWLRTEYATAIFWKAYVASGLFGNLLHAASQYTYRDAA